MSAGKTLRFWRRHRRWALLLALVCELTLLLIYGLYGLRWGPAFYTVIVTCFVLLIAAGFDLVSFRRQMQELQLLEKRAAHFLGELPEINDPLGAQHLALTAAVARKHRLDLAAAAETAAQADQYYTRWSHQIKTPIAAMGLLLHDEQIDRQAMELELLKTEQYVDMALQYQRLSASENDLVIKRHSLDAIVRRAVKRVSRLFIGKQIKLELGELQREVLTDEKWLTFVLEQLLTNAIKYTPPSGSIRVFLRKGPCLLVVEDTGIGILPEDLPRVFEWGYTGGAGRLEQRATGTRSASSPPSARGRACGWIWHARNSKRNNLTAL